MKKYPVWITFALFTLLLAACSTVQGLVSGGSADPAQAAATGQPRDLPQSMKLILATFKLDDTQHPLTAEQAAAMLPLWKALKALTGSDTAAPQEVQAVLNQIEAGLTPEQVAEVQAMNLSFQDVRALSEKLGLRTGFGGGDPSVMATMQAARQSGGGPGGPGGMPFPGGPGGGPPPGEGGISREARQTAQARNGGQGGGGLRLSPAMLDAVIKFLQAKAAQ